MTLVGKLRIHLGARHPLPGQLGGGVVHLDQVALLIHRREGVVDVGDLVPGNVVHQVGGQAVLAGAPGGEVTDDPAGMVIPHALAAIGAVDLANVAGEVATCGRQRGLFHGDIDLGRLTDQVPLVCRHQFEAGDPLALGRPVQLPGGAAIFTHLLAIHIELDPGHIVVGIGHIGRDRGDPAQGQPGAGGRAADAGLGRFRGHHGADGEADICLAQQLAILVQGAGLELMGADAARHPAGRPGGRAAQCDLGAIDQVLHLDQGAAVTAQGYRQGHRRPLVESVTNGGRAYREPEARRRAAIAEGFPGIGPDGTHPGRIVIGRGATPAGVRKFLALIEVADVADDIASLVGGAGLIGGIGGLRPGGHGRKGDQHGEPAGP
ncbi:hypothetical protein D3C79_538150 [compost metagenome]